MSSNGGLSCAASAAAKDVRETDAHFHVDSPHEVRITCHRSGRHAVDRSLTTAPTARYRSLPRQRTGQTTQVSSVVNRGGRVGRQPQLQCGDADFFAAFPIHPELACALLDLFKEARFGAPG